MTKIKLMKSIGMLFGTCLFFAYTTNEVSADEYKTYEVKTGDSLSKIAVENNSSLESLLTINTQISNPDLIFVGDKINVSRITEVKTEEKGVEKATQTTAQSNGYAHPLNMPGAIVSSEFGYREDPTGYSGTQHNGIDLAVPTGTAVYAAKSGVVVDAGFHYSAGNYVIVKHNDTYTYYFHLNSINVSVNQQVGQLEFIGKVGNTGYSTGPHLHFGVSTGLWSGYMNPRNYVNF